MARSSTTAVGGGVRWFNTKGPNDFSQSLSVMASEVNGMAGQLVSDTVDLAKRRMQEIIIEGGINQTQKGGSRVLSGDMYNSVEASVSLDNGRATGKFGFSDNAPAYTDFQERGTHLQGPMQQSAIGSAGIAPMLAYATARQEADTFFGQTLHTTAWFQTSKLHERRRR